MKITASHGTTRIVITLYGEITDARVAQETAVAKYRAEQLAPRTLPISRWDDGE